MNLKFILTLSVITASLITMGQKDEGQYVFKTTNLTRYEFPTHINDLVMDRSKAKFSDAFVVVIEPDKGPLLHRHNNTKQIFYMLEGIGTLIVRKDDPVHLKASSGDIIRVPIGTWHTVKQIREKTIRYLEIDCFGDSRKSNEPTWDSHVKVLCKEQGWEYSKVKLGNKN